MAPWKAAILAGILLVPLGDGARYEMLEELMQDISFNESVAEADAHHLDVSNENCRISPSMDDLGKWLQIAAILDEPICTDFGKEFGWYGPKQCPKSIREVADIYEAEESHAATGGKSGAPVMITPQYVVKVISVKEAVLMTKFLKMHTGQGKVMSPASAKSKSRARRGSDEATATPAEDTALQLTTPDPGLSFIVPICRWVLVDKPDSKWQQPPEDDDPVDMKKNLIMIIMPNMMIETDKEQVERMTFDLKGNYLYERRLADWDKSTWKDVNFFRKFPNGMNVYKTTFKEKDVFGDGALFLETMRKDTANMLKHELMDYSLLVDMVDFCPQEVFVEVPTFRKGVRVKLEGFMGYRTSLNGQAGVIQEVAARYEGIGVDDAFWTTLKESVGTALKVEDQSGFSKGDKIKIASVDGSAEEEVIVQSVSDGSLGLSVELQNTYQIGAKITRVSHLGARVKLDEILVEVDFAHVKVLAFRPGMRVQLKGFKIIQDPEGSRIAVTSDQPIDGQKGFLERRDEASGHWRVKLDDGSVVTMPDHNVKAYDRDAFDVTGDVGIYESAGSHKIIGKLTPGDYVVRSGPPIVSGNGKTFQPISPRGAVESRSLVTKAPRAKCEPFSRGHTCTDKKQDGESTGVVIVAQWEGLESEDSCREHCVLVAARCCEFDLYGKEGNTCIARRYDITGIRLHSIEKHATTRASMCSQQAPVRVELKGLTGEKELFNGQEGDLKRVKGLGVLTSTGVWHVKLDSMVVTVPVDNLKEVLHQGSRRSALIPAPGEQALELGYFKRLGENYGGRPVYHRDSQEFIYYNPATEKWHISHQKGVTHMGVTTVRRPNKPAAQCPHDEPEWVGLRQRRGDGRFAEYDYLTVTNVDRKKREVVIAEKNKNKPLLWVEADGLRFVLSIGIIDIFMHGRDRGRLNEFATKITRAKCAPDDIDPIREMEYRVRFMRMFGYKDPEYKGTARHQEYCGFCLGPQSYTYFHTDFQRKKHSEGACEWGK